MTIESDIAALQVSVSELVFAINVKKTDLDAAALAAQTNADRIDLGSFDADLLAASNSADAAVAAAIAAEASADRVDLGDLDTAVTTATTKAAEALASAATAVSEAAIAVAAADAVALFDAGLYLDKAGNLSGLADTAVAQANLGMGGLARAMTTASLQPSIIPGTNAQGQGQIENYSVYVGFVTTPASNPAGLTLPDLPSEHTGKTIAIMNRSIVGTFVYPPSGDQLNGLVDTPVLLPPRHYMMAFRRGNANWECFTLPISSQFKIAFSMNKGGTDQTGLLPNTWTRLTFSTAEINVGGYFASSKFTPPAGRYRLSGGASFSVGVLDGNLYGVAIYKNGVLFRESQTRPGAALQQAAAISVLVNADGTDEFEMFGYGGGAGNKTVFGAASHTWFSGEEI